MLLFAVGKRYVDNLPSSCNSGFSDAPAPPQQRTGNAQHCRRDKALMRNRHEPAFRARLFSALQASLPALATREPGRHRNMLPITKENFPTPDQRLAGLQCGMMAGTALY